MPYTIKTKANVKKRYLLSGLPNTGKSDSLVTFIYGNREYLDDSGELTEEAIEYADDRHMVVLVCPGEKGSASLAEGLHITNYIHETNVDPDKSLDWSKAAIDEFGELCREVLHSGTSIFAIDGLHSLYEHEMNIITGGAYLEGRDFDTKLYGNCHAKFGQFLSTVYASKIPLVIMTTWEDYELIGDNLSRTEQAQAERLATKALWPSLPGKMAKRLIGHFDARLSCQIEKVCLHKGCEDSNPVQKKGERAIPSQEHHVWQFLPKNDVRGVGIKGLRKVSKTMKATPWIHQNYQTLERLLEQVT